MCADKLLQDGRTPLHFAVENRQLELVIRLADAGAIPNLNERERGKVRFLGLICNVW
jgi:hypothetical protein